MWHVFIPVIFDFYKILKSKFYFVVKWAQQVSWDINAQDSHLLFEWLVGYQNVYKLDRLDKLDSSTLINYQINILLTKVGNKFV